MHSAVHDLLPPAVRRSLGKLGADIARARRDDIGLQLDDEQLPKRVRLKKSPTSV